MVVELLRKGHTGPILRCLYASGPTWATPRSTVNSSRADANYTYFPMPTREPDVPKRYIQNLISDGVIEGELGLTLDPENTHAFLVANLDDRFARGR